MKFKISTPQIIRELPAAGTPTTATFPSPSDADASARYHFVCRGQGEDSVSGKAAAAACSAVGRCIRLNADSDYVFGDNELDTLLRATRERLDEELPRRGPKATVSMALLCLHRGGALMVHAGDCRILHVRPSRSALLYSSTPDEAPLRPHADDTGLPTAVRSLDVRPGDRFLLVAGPAPEETALRECLNERRLNAAGVSQRLHSLFQATPGEHAAVLVEVESMELEAADALQPDDEATRAGIPAAAKPRPVSAEEPGRNAKEAAAGTGEGAAAAAPADNDCPARTTAETDDSHPLTAPAAAACTPPPMPGGRRPTPIAPRATAGKRPAWKATRNWVLSLAGIVFVGFAAWYVFGGDSAPEPQTVEAPPAEMPANPTGPTDMKNIDWLGGGADTPAGDSDTERKEKAAEPKDEEPAEHEEESLSEEAIMDPGTAPTETTEPAKPHHAEPAAPVTPPAEEKSHTTPTEHNTPHTETPTE